MTVLFYKVADLASATIKPNSFYAIKADNNRFDLYLTTNSGEALKVNSDVKERSELIII